MIIFLFLALCQALPFDYSNTPSTAVGDPGNFYLNSEGISIGVLNDDYLGSTDKLMTGSTSISYFFPKTSSWTKVLSLNRRLFTPVIKTHFRNQEIFPIQGLYADELEGRIDFSYQIESLKFELGGGLESFGNYGGAAVHDEIHNLVGSPNELTRFGALLHLNSPTITLGAGVILDPQLLWMNYVVRSAVMSSFITRFSFVSGIFAADVYGGYNFASDVYEHLKPFRWGSGLSIRYHWYQATVNYSSIYLDYDRFGQYYISPLIIHFEI